MQLSGRWLIAAILNKRCFKIQDCHLSIFYDGLRKGYIFCAVGWKNYCLNIVHNLNYFLNKDYYIWH